MDSKCNIRGTRDIKNTVYDYFSSDTFNEIPELVSYRSLKGLQLLISNKLLCERYQISSVQTLFFFFFFFCIKFITFISECKKNHIGISKL